MFCGMGKMHHSEGRMTDGGGGGGEGVVGRAVEVWG